MTLSNGYKMIARFVAMILTIVFVGTLLGCKATKTTGPMFSKQSAIQLLNNSVKKDGNTEFIEYTTNKATKSTFKWDDGSYYVFYLRNKAAAAAKDIRNIFVVKKSTKDIYQLDLAKDSKGNILKKYVLKK